MFGVPIYPTKPAMLNANPRHLNKDRFLRSSVPNSNYKTVKYIYDLKKHNTEDRANAEFIKKKIKDDLIVKNELRNDSAKYIRLLKERTEIKINEYVKIIEERRVKLNELLAKEEKQFMNEVVLQSLTFKDQQYEEKRQNVIDVKAKKEKERLQFVHDMKFRQYADRCEELRPLISSQKLHEVAAAQKIQKVEDKLRKECEKELSVFWDDLQAKQIEEMKVVVEQKALQNLKVEKEFTYYLNRQLEEQKVLAEHRRLEKLQEAKELEQLKENIRQEEKAEKERKHKLRLEISNDLEEDVKLKQETLKKQTEDELRITRAYEKIANEELRREEEKIKNKTSTALRDMNLYSKYLKELEAENREKDKIMDQIVANKMDEICRKKDAEMCKMITASKTLLKSCITTNGKMLEEKRIEKERLNKKAEEEREFTEFTRQQTNALKAEETKQKKLAAKKYREDLDMQVKYSQILKEREREKQKRVVKAAEEEDRKYDAIVAEMLGDASKQSKFHPFKRVVIEELCPCPKPNY